MFRQRPKARTQHLLAAATLTLLFLAGRTVCGEPLQERSSTSYRSNNNTDRSAENAQPAVTLGFAEISPEEDSASQGQVASPSETWVSKESGAAHSPAPLPLSV